MLLCDKCCLGYVLRGSHDVITKYVYVLNMFGYIKRKLA